VFASWLKAARVELADAQAWLDRYIAAWLSYDANDVEALHQGRRLPVSPL
jgi:hypothetical protein